LSSSEIEFNGKTTPERVDAFIAAHEPLGAEIHVVDLTSTGGEVSSAIRLAQWIHKNSLDVRVRLICISSCANYLFPAGRAKTIDPHALVIWHGSAEQKNFREAQASYEELLAAQAKRELSPGELSTL